MDGGEREVVAWVGREVLPHEADVRRWLRRRLDDPSAVDDVIQDAYCRLADLKSVSHIASGRAYFMMTVRNILADRIRRARIVRIDAVDLDGLHVADEDPSPEQVVHARRQLKRVSALIAALPAKCRRVFIMRRIEGVPQREIARRLAISENTVESQAVRALKLILSGLAEDEGDGLEDRAGAAGRSQDIRQGAARGRRR